MFRAGVLLVLGFVLVRHSAADTLQLCVIIQESVYLPLDPLIRLRIHSWPSALDATKRVSDLRLERSDV